MNFKRIGRLLVCLVLICALLINFSPIKARALEPVSTAVVASKLIIPAVVMGLGIFIGSNPDLFNGLCDSIRQLWETAGYIVNGMCIVFRLTNGGFAVKQDLIDTARDFIFESGTVSGCYSYSDTAGTWTSYRGSTYRFTKPFYSFKISYYDASDTLYYYDCVAIIGGTSYYFGDSTTSSTCADGIRVQIDGVGKNVGLLRVGGSAETESSSTLIGGAIHAGKFVTDVHYNDFEYAVMSVLDGILNGDYDSELYVKPGLAKGFIAAHSLLLGLGYPDWSPVPVYDQDQDKDLMYYPLGFGQTLEETLGLTQEQIWAGETTYKEDLEQTQDQTLLQQLGQWFGQVLETLTSIPLQILNGLGQILIDVLSYLFVPTQDFLQAKIQALTQRFGFVSSLVNTGKAISTGLSGVTTEPPVIYIDLSAFRGSYDLGGKVAFLDLRWYAEYKPTVDMLISAFLWICFVWRLLLKLPGIIGGMPGDWVMGSAHALGLDSHLPTRNAAFEVQRQSNREIVRKGR